MQGGDFENTVAVDMEQFCDHYCTACGASFTQDEIDADTGDFDTFWICSNCGEQHDHDELPEAPDFAADDVDLECPECGAEVPYADVLANNEDQAVCPICWVPSDPEDWFAEAST